MLRRALVPLCLAGLLAPVALVPAVHAQGASVRLPELGLTLAPPSRYVAVPLPPRTLYTVAQFVEGGGRPDGEIPPTLQVHVILRPVAGVGRDRIVDTESFVQRVLRPSRVESLRGGSKRYGHTPRRFEVEWEVDGVSYKSFVHGWEGPWRTVIVQGFSDPSDYDRRRRAWQRVAETIKIENPRDDGARRELERYYSGRRFKDVEYRIDVRLSLVDGWNARDTEHYIVLYNEETTEYVGRVASDLESLRKTLVRDLPADHPTQAASTVRLCRDREEYLAYGGMTTAVGYFSPMEEELVLYEQDERGEDVTFQTLYHEAFHQYVYVSAGRLSPHSWFDEGTGEYYAGSHIVGGRVEVGVLTDSLAFIKHKVFQDEHAPLAELVAMDQAAYYADADLHYTQGWAFVHFLRTSPEVRRNPRWSRILTTYFTTLKETQAQSLADEERPSALRVAAAGTAARQAALDAAFENIDMLRLEAAWVSYVLGLK